MSSPLFGRVPGGSAGRSILLKHLKALRTSRFSICAGFCLRRGYNRLTVGVDCLNVVISFCPSEETFPAMFTSPDIVIAIRFS